MIQKRIFNKIKIELWGIIIALIFIFQSCGGSVPTRFALKQGEYLDLMNQANMMSLKGDYKGALKFYDEACRNFILIDDMSSLIECYLNVATNFLRQEKDKKVLFYFAKAEKIAVDFKLTTNLAKIYMQRGLYYIKQGEADKAAIAMDEAIRHYKIKDNEKEGLYRAYSYKGYILRLQKKWKKSREALNIAMESKNPFIQSYALYNLAHIDAQQEKYADAIEKLQKAIALDRQEVFTKYLVYDYFLLGQIWYKKKDSGQAKMFLLKAYLLADTLQDKDALNKIRTFEKSMK